MAGWYSIGTVTVTNGSTVVTGAGTDFYNNASPRDAFALIGGNPNEIASVDSPTQISLARPWLGASAAGQAYVIIPTVGVYVDLALRALNMLVPFQAVLDGIGQGLMPSGTLALPGIRFAVDQDTGFRRFGDNALALVTGGADRFSVDGTGNATVSSGNMLFAGAKGIGIVGLPAEVFTMSDGQFGPRIATDGTFRIVSGNLATERMRVDGAGNLLMGVTGGNAHLFNKAAAQGAQLAGFFSTVASNTSMDVFVCGGAGANASATAVKLGSNTATGRSLNAGGTINASGADYAEYVAKEVHCGAIAKGDVCGVTSEGLLTRTWAKAVRFVVKSTDPNLVGGDTWAAHLSERPEAPGPAPVEPVAPTASALRAIPNEPVREAGEDDLDFIRRMAAFLIAASSAASAVEADRAEVAAYSAAAAAYPEAKAQHDAAVAAYDVAVAEWEAALEEARQSVDRIAFCGQVPINVPADTLAVCEAALADGEAVYLVAVARGSGIGASAVRESDMTLPLYMRRVGVVWAIRDGRPWIDVQHG